MPARFSVIEHHDGHDRYALDLEFAPTDEQKKLDYEAFREEMPATRRHGFRIFKGHALTPDDAREFVGQQKGDG